MIAEKEIAIFCSNVRHLRQSHALTVQEMADICDIEPEDLKKLEQGTLTENITVDVAIRLFHYFKISPEQLFIPMLQ